MFVTGVEGILVAIADAAETRYRYAVRFDCTRRTINEIRPGVLLAVPNYTDDQHSRRYSVLVVTTVLPVQERPAGGVLHHPGGMMPAGRSKADDGKTRTPSADGEIATLWVGTVPVNLEIVEPPHAEPLIVAAGGIGKLGARVRVLDSDYVRRLCNRRLNGNYPGPLTVIGALASNLRVEILLRTRELCRTPFAVFGSAGAGKSNLLSTLIAKLFKDSQEPLKLALFDFMGEHTALLIDQLLAAGHGGGVLTLGRHTLPEGVFKYINGQPGAPALTTAVQQLQRWTPFPATLVDPDNNLARALQTLIETQKLVYFNETRSVTVFDLFFSEHNRWGRERRKQSYLEKRQELAKEVLRLHLPGGGYGRAFTSDLARQIRAGIEARLAQDDTFAEDYAPLLEQLRALEAAAAETFPAGVTLDQLVGDLNDPNHPSLWIVQAQDPDQLRSFSKQLGRRLYEERRLQGIAEPQVVFVFEEADEFIGQDGAGSYAESAEIARLLARLGRKFGLGLGITARHVCCLDPAVMARLETCFIARLSGAADRQAAAEAGGVSEEWLHQPLGSARGEWLLVSRGATGLENIPIAIRAPDADERITAWLRAPLTGGEERLSGPAGKGGS